MLNVNAFKVPRIARARGKTLLKKNELFLLLKGGLITVTISVHSEKCNGCRACEIACSYHHRRVFSRKKGSITVLRNEKEGKMIPVFSRVEGKEYLSCDGCFNEKEPLCVKYCTTGALEAV